MRNFLLPKSWSCVLPHFCQMLWQRIKQKAWFNHRSSLLTAVLSIKWFQFATVTRNHDVPLCRRTVCTVTHRCVSHTQLAVWYQVAADDLHRSLRVSRLHGVFAPRLWLLRIPRPATAALTVHHRHAFISQSRVISAPLDRRRLYSRQPAHHIECIVTPRHRATYIFSLFTVYTLLAAVFDP